MKPEVKQFTKDNPCTKKDIWECFRGRRGFRSVTKPEAESIIGKNAPRNMLSRGYVYEKHSDQADFYVLTEEGKEWLQKGIASYIKNHPEEVDEITNLPAALRRG